MFCQLAMYLAFELAYVASLIVSDIFDADVGFFVRWLPVVLCYSMPVVCVSCNNAMVLL